MEQTGKVLFILAVLAVIALMMGFSDYWFGVAPALLTDDVNDADAVILGDSSVPATDNIKGPSYLTANVPLFFPPPLAHLNPVTSDQISGC